MPGVQPVTPEFDLDKVLNGVRPRDMLLATDFDGTLAPIVPEADQARALPESLAALEELAGSLGTVAVISGRSTDALRRLLPLAGVELLGDYGLTDPTPAETAALAEFNRAAGGLVDGFEGVHLEAKPGSTAVHHRSRPELGEELLGLLRPLAEAMGLRAGRGRMVVEVRPARADKAVALERLIKERRPAAILFLGDDEGDRAALELVGRQSVPHLAVGVRSDEAPHDLFDSCGLVVDGPPAAAGFLSRLARWASRPAPAGPAAGG